MNDKLAIIIPTRNREESLIRLLNSITEQEYLPSQIIIIDGSDKPSSDFIKKFSNFNILYKITECRSSSKARNIGIKLVGEETDFICILDDDIVLEKGALSSMRNSWEMADENVAGISFNIIDTRQSNWFYITFFKSIFFMESHKKGKVLISGFNNPYCPATKTHYCEWFGGGLAVWRKRILDKYKFDEWFEGYSFCEDLDISYRISRSFKLLVDVNAKVRHLMDINKKNANFMTGRSQVANRIYFVKKHKNLSVFLCIVASCAQCVNNFLKGILLFNKHLICRSFGNFIAIFEVIFK